MLTLRTARRQPMNATSHPARTAKPDDSELPTELAQARRFGKTRSAQSTALLEDYVELIADLLTNAGEARPTDIARRLGVSHATAIKTISRLKRAGMATARPYRGVFLTEAGMGLAQRVRARHRLVVDLLRDPYDAEFIREGVTCLTAFGWRACQLQAAIAQMCSLGEREG